MQFHLGRLGHAQVRGTFSTPDSNPMLKLGRTGCGFAISPRPLGTHTSSGHFFNTGFGSDVETRPDRMRICNFVPAALDTCKPGARIQHRIQIRDVGPRRGLSTPMLRLDRTGCGFTIPGPWPSAAAAWCVKTCVELKLWQSTATARQHRLRMHRGFACQPS